MADKASAEDIQREFRLVDCGGQSFDGEAVDSYSTERRSIRRDPTKFLFRGSTIDSAAGRYPVSYEGLNPSLGASSSPPRGGRCLKRIYNPSLQIRA